MNETSLTPPHRAQSGSHNSGFFGRNGAEEGHGASISQESQGDHEQSVLPPRHCKVAHVHSRSARPHCVFLPQVIVLQALKLKTGLTVSSV